jgi:hypothetical protein
MLSTTLIHAQEENDLVNFLEAGKEDASKLINAYLNPMIQGAAYGFSNGWYTTAKAHKTLGFDFGVTANAVFIPSSKNYFNPSDLQLTTVDHYSSPLGNGKAPTLTGPDKAVTYYLDKAETRSFEGPKGVDFKDNLKISGVLVPTAQLGIGIIKNTDLKIRWTPEIKYSNSKVKVFGFGVLHDVKQHIPGIKLLPFDLSVLVAYTKISGSTSLAGKFQPVPTDTRAQEITYSMNAWTAQALISKKVAIVTFYGAVGYNAAKTTSDVVGSYVIPSTALILKDPVSLSFKDKSFRITAGTRFNFGPIYLSADYTLQQYSTVSVGLGATVR